MPPALCRTSFPFLRWPIRPFSETVDQREPDPLLAAHLAKARYSIRLLRYWWAAQAIRQECQRRAAAGLEPPVIADYGSGRGWLKRFVGSDVAARWIALDWQPEQGWLRAAGYEDIRPCHFDQPLPLTDGEADVVVALHVFEHLPRVGYSLAEISRALSGGGFLLAATPTMPGLLADIREKQFRRRLAEGRLARGGHINSFSPERLRMLMESTGLGVEFVTGSHLIRHTGNPLENLRPWVRLNQLWGSLFPSLGSEACLLARKPAVEDPDVAAWSPQPLRRGAGRPRLAVAAAAVASLILLTGAVWSLWEQGPERSVHAVMMSQFQLDASHFLVVSHPAIPEFGPDDRIDIVDHVGQIPGRLPDAPAGTHILIHETDLAALGDSGTDYIIDSRIDAGWSDFYVLRVGGSGTRLSHFLSETEREG